MKCELCGKDPRVIIILPIRQADGRLDTMSCEKCAKKSAAYCKKHDRPHQGFMDGSTACLWCIEELVNANQARATTLREEIRRSIPAEDNEDLTEAAEMNAALADCSESVAILRYVASKAVRTRQTIDEIVGVIAHEQSIAHILWK